MAVIEAKPGVFETMRQWLTVQIDRTERTARRQSTRSDTRGGPQAVGEPADGPRHAPPGQAEPG